MSAAWLLDHRRLLPLLALLLSALAGPRLVQLAGGASPDGRAPTCDLRPCDVGSLRQSVVTGQATPVTTDTVATPVPAARQSVVPAIDAPRITWPRGGGGPRAP